MGEQEWRVDSEEGFMACYRASVRHVFRYSAMLCGSDRGAAEDMTQEMYLALLRRARAGEVSAVTLGYLRLAVRHRFLDEVKRREREQRRLELVAAVDEPHEQPVELDHFADLSERERAAMVLRYVDDLPVAGVARAMDISTRAAESLLARATRRLRGGERRHG